MTTDPTAFQRRHPQCSECGYDLVGTVAAGGRTCPECGEGFTLGDLRVELRADDWTPLRGMRTLAMALVVRMLWLIPLWVGVLWALSPVLRFFTQTIRYRTYGWLALLLAVPACVLGYLVARNTVEILGCASIVVYVFVIVAIAAVVTAGLWIVGIWNVLPTGFEGFVAFVSIAGASLYAVHEVFDDS